MAHWTVFLISFSLLFLITGTNRSQAFTSQMAIGSLHMCAVLSDGTVKCWGWSGLGTLLGNSNTEDQQTPQAVSHINTAMQIDAGNGHSCVVLREGIVKCWGVGSLGQLGVGNDENQAVSISVKGISSAVQVATGSFHSCVLLNDGTIRCWGSGSEGQLGNEQLVNQLIPVTVNGINQARQVVAGGNHTCALLMDKTVQCWGAGNFGQLGSDEVLNQSTPVAVKNLMNVSQITAGEIHTCALLEEGSIKCWGGGAKGQLGNGSSSDQLTPVDVDNIDKATQIIAGGAHTCALLDGGQLKCWGDNEFGQLGNGENALSYSPSDVTLNAEPTQIMAGSVNTCAIIIDSSIKCWGSGREYQLGNGSVSDQNTPVDVEHFSRDGFVTISKGTFTMGDIQGNGQTWEKPAHSVTISKNFQIMDHEVTVNEYNLCVVEGGCQYEGSTTDLIRTFNVKGKESYPMNHVSWDDTQDYINWKSQKDPSHVYRLCTEAEWEYVARVGTETSWICGDNGECIDGLVWYGGNDDPENGPKPVKTKEANDWEIHDMLGNVFEWVNDWYSEVYYSDLVEDANDPQGPDTGSERTVRGGYFGSGILELRSSFRRSKNPSFRGAEVGFRLCRTSKANSTARGQAIIVAGGGSHQGNNLWLATNVLTLKAYDIFKKRGFLDDEIYLFHPNPSIDLHEDGVYEPLSDDITPTVVDFQNQIKSFQSSLETGPLYIYLVDHGVPDRFQIAPDEELTSSELNHWLNEFQNSTQRTVVVIIEACYSGTFVNDLQRDGRLILTSSDDKVSFISHQGDISYSGFLFQALYKGNSFQEAHEISLKQLKNDGRPYNSMSPQISTNNVDLKIGGNFVISNNLSPILLDQPSETNIVGRKNTFYDLQIGLNRHDGIDKVWSVIVPPNFLTPTVSEGFNTPQVHLPQIELQLQDAENHIFTGKFKTEKYAGNYQVQHFVLTSFGDLVSSQPIFISVETGESPTMKDYTPNIQPGWQLIGINQPLLGDTVSKQLINIWSSIGSIWAWNTETANWQIHVNGQSITKFNEVNNSSYEYLQRLDIGKAYWIYFKSPAFHEFEEVPRTEPLSLKHGWNLVTLNAGPIEALLPELPTSTDSIWLPDGDDWKVYSLKTESHQVGDFELLTEIQISQGYWVKIQ